MVSINRKTLVKLVQYELNHRYGLKLRIDGDAGRRTMAALHRISAIPSTYTMGKRIIAFIQYITILEPQIDDVVIDGLLGPATEHAIQQITAIRKNGRVDLWRDRIEANGGANPFAHFTRILTTRDDSGVDWPEEVDLRKFYGEIGENWVPTARLPFSLKLAWDTKRTIQRFTVNRKIKVQVENIFDEIYNVYSADEIRTLGLDLWAGASVVRKIRGGSRYSSHSYGCSIDINSSDNKLRWDKNQATMAGPEYEKFWTAIYRNGGRSLGIERDYDFMHWGFYRYK